MIKLTFNPCRILKISTAKVANCLILKLKDEVCGTVYYFIIEEFLQVDTMPIRCAPYNFHTNSIVIEKLV